MGKFILYVLIILILLAWVEVITWSLFFIIVSVMVAVFIILYLYAVIKEKRKFKKDMQQGNKGVNSPSNEKMFSSSLSIEEAEWSVINRIEQAIKNLSSLEHITEADIILYVNPIAMDIYEIGMVDMNNRELGEKYLELSGYKDMQTGFLITDFIFNFSTGYFANKSKRELAVYMLEQTTRIANQTLSYDDMFKTGNVEPILHFITETLKETINNYSPNSVNTNIPLDRISFEIYSIAMVKLNNEILGKELLKKDNYIKLQKDGFIKDFKQKMSDHYFDSMDETDIYNYLNDYSMFLAKLTIYLEKHSIIK